MKSPAEIVLDAIDASSMPDSEKALAKMNIWHDLPVEAWLPMDYFGKRAAYLAGLAGIRHEHALKLGRGDVK